MYNKIKGIIAGGFEQANFSTVKKVIINYTDNQDINLSDYVDLSYSRAGQDVR